MWRVCLSIRLGNVKCFSLCLFSSLFILPLVCACIRIEGNFMLSISIHRTTFSKVDFVFISNHKSAISNPGPDINSTAHIFASERWMWCLFYAQFPAMAMAWWDFEVIWRKLTILCEKRPKSVEKILRSNFSTELYEELTKAQILWWKFWLVIINTS